MLPNVPAEGSDRQPFGFVILEFPQRKKGTLLVPELIRWILKVFEICAGMKGKDEIKAEKRKREDSVQQLEYNMRQFTTM